MNRFCLYLRLFAASDETNNYSLFLYRLSASLAKIGNRILNRLNAVFFKDDFGLRRAYSGVILTRAKRRMIDFYAAFYRFQTAFDIHLFVRLSVNIFASAARFAQKSNCFLQFRQYVKGFALGLPYHKSIRVLPQKHGCFNKPLNSIFFNRRLIFIPRPLRFH